MSTAAHAPVSTTSSTADKTYTITDLVSRQPTDVSAAELRARFERDGVVILPGFLSTRDMAPLRTELDVQYAARAATAATAHNGVGKYEKFACDVMVWAPIAEKSPPFLELNDSAKLRDVTEAVIGGGYTSSPSGLVMFSVGGGRGQAWHQDCPPEGGTTAFNLNRLFYTDDVALEDGAIVFVPGSHKAGRIPPGGHQEPIAGEVALEPRAGTLVLLHGHVYHRVTPNLNQKPRTSINFRAFPAGTSTSVVCIGVYRNGEVNFCDANKQHDGKPAAMQPATM